MLSYGFNLHANVKVFPTTYFLIHLYPYSQNNIHPKSGIISKKMKDTHTQNMWLKDTIIILWKLVLHEYCHMSMTGNHRGIKRD